MIRPLAFFLTIVAGVLQSRADTVLYYHFDEGPLNQFASNVIDSGPNNIQGIGRNVGTASLPVFRNAPSPGLWMQFNGKGDSIPTVASFVEIEDPGNSPLDLTGPMTIEAVIHPTLIDHQVITRKFTLAGSGYNFDIDSGGHLTFRLQDDNTSAISSMALQPNKTYHVAGTWDGSMIRVYVNHALDGQFPYNGPLHANNDEMGIGAVI